MIRPIVVIGAGGLGRETLEVLKRSRHHKQPLLGFIDDNPEFHGKILNGYPVLGGCEWFEEYGVDKVLAVCGIGGNETRKKVTKRVEGMGVGFTNAIHPNATIGDFVKLGKGVVITSGNTLTCNIDVGNHVFLNLDSTIGHDCIIEDYVNLSPGAHISGNCTLLEGSHIYSGAVLIPGITVGRWSIIGAGAVVRENVPDHSISVGVPAKVIKTHEIPERARRRE